VPWRSPVNIHVEVDGKTARSSSECVLAGQNVGQFPRDAFVNERPPDNNAVERPLPLIWINPAETAREPLDMELVAGMSATVVVQPMP